MKEYHIVFNHKPGTDTQIPEDVFVELESEDGLSIGKGAWSGCGSDGLIKLILPMYEEERDKLLEVVREFMNWSNMQENFGLSEVHNIAALRNMATRALEEIS